MTRYIAFLRAINVGGHTVKMETLRHLFETMGFKDVETFIASGNVVFQSPAEDTALLESTIASGLRHALGYNVATFIRTEAELIQIMAHQAFPQPELDAAMANNIVFLANPLKEEEKRKLMALTTEIDHFAVHGREITWLCGKRQSESTFSNAVLEKPRRKINHPRCEYNRQVGRNSGEMSIFLWLPMNYDVCSIDI